MSAQVAFSRSGPVARARLDAPEKLNALDLEMAQALDRRLQDWEADDAVACIFLEGAGPRGFCAGGDVEKLYRSAIDHPGGPCPYAEAFFEQEYRLDYRLHRYRKPVIGWGHGIVMGGGLGLIQGCRHRVGTDSARFALPEAQIGLYPDIGAGWFLQRMPGALGLFAALTGLRFSGADLRLAQLADYLIAGERKEEVFAALCAADWRGAAQADHAAAQAVLRSFERESGLARAPGGLAGMIAPITQACGAGRVQQIAARLQAWTGAPKAIGQAIATLKTASPLSLHLIHRHVTQTRGLDLAEVFRRELTLSVNIMRRGDFAEGVRARLISRDNAPRWRYASLDEVDESFAAGLFAPPWSDHPLDDLA